MAFVVPVAGDKIKTEDNDNEFVVTSYTNLKQEPAVYIDALEGENNTIYFYDIQEINGVKVDHNRASKIFEALGVFKRKYNLPQPNDSIVVETESPAGETEEKTVKVKSIKLHNITEGKSRGLVVCDDEACYDLTQIKNVIRLSGGEKFDAKKFKKYYFDYFPYRGKSKK
jgi:hypothetical protein